MSSFLVSLSSLSLLRDLLADIGILSQHKKVDIEMGHIQPYLHVIHGVIKILYNWNQFILI